jgi:peroxiredoxin Q/BCP
VANIKIKVGDLVPDSELEAYPDRKKVKLSAYRGKWLVLYFYPRDNTSGCTKEACGFRDSSKLIKDLGAEVLGVSTDSLSSHERFAGKYHLDFTLLSDSKGELGSLLGALKENGSSMYRVTFLIDPDGRIAKIYPKVDPLIHPAEIVNDLKAMKIR